MDRDSTGFPSATPSWLSSRATTRSVSPSVVPGPRLMRNWTVTEAVGRNTWEANGSLTRRNTEFTDDAGVVLPVAPVAPVGPVVPPVCCWSGTGRVTGRSPPGSDGPVGPDTVVVWFGSVLACPGVWATGQPPRIVIQTSAAVRNVARSGPPKDFGLMNGNLRFGTPFTNDGPTAPTARRPTLPRLILDGNRCRVNFAIRGSGAVLGRRSRDRISARI